MGGDIEEAFSFGRPLTEDDVAFYYRAYWGNVVCWQGTLSSEGARLAIRSLLDSLTMDAIDPPPPPGGGGDEGEDPGVTNTPPIYALGLGLCLYPPILTGPNSVSLMITNTVDSGWLTNLYDLFYTTNLASLPEPALCMTNWAFLQRSTPGQTNFVVSELSASECYFRLGTMLDSDADGLTDAYELLVSKTLVSTNDTDGDGMSDGWEVHNDLNPLANDASDDPDGDWFTNLQRIQWRHQLDKSARLDGGGVG